MTFRACFAGLNLAPLSKLVFVGLRGDMSILVRVIGRSS